MITKVTSHPNNLCNISQDNSESLKDLATSINLDQILNLQSKLKGTENYIRNSNQPKLWLEIHLLGMLSDEYSQVNIKVGQSSATTLLENSSNDKNINNKSKNIDSNINKQTVEVLSSQEENHKIQNINLDDIWEKVIAMLELPSTKMLLSQQAKLININSESAEISISGKWINMIQSRKNIIEDAFYKARGCKTKIILIQQKDNLLNKIKEESTQEKITEKNELKIDNELDKNNLEDKKKSQTKNNLDTNSIDQKAKQFADFFNGEIVNLE